MANPSVRPCDLSGNNSQHILATLDNGKPVFNRGAIMRRAWRLYHHEQKTADEWKARGQTVTALSLGECMKQAWADAHGFASSLQYSQALKAAPAPVQRVVDLQMKTRLGVSGLKQLGNAIADRARAAL